MMEGQGERQDEVANDEDVVAKEEAAAATEAGSICGHRDESVDEAERPVSEGGGGEAEGFELSEQELVDEAEQEQRHDPLAEAGEPEAEDPKAEYGEPDRVDSTAREEEPPDEPRET
ncbi:MAG TPA: hypothetical protein VKA47_09625 [Solirubrobacterales bacterium]|nr:hypothetical protein [Solirubrobacterales bacterium]